MIYKTRTPLRIHTFSSSLSRLLFCSDSSWDLHAVKKNWARIKKSRASWLIREWNPHTSEGSILSPWCSWVIYSNNLFYSLFVGQSKHCKIFWGISAQRDSLGEWWNCPRNYTKVMVAQIFEKYLFELHILKDKFHSRQDIVLQKYKIYC